MTETQDHVAACEQIRQRLTTRHGADLQVLRDEGLRQAEGFRLSLVEKGYDAVLSEHIVQFRRDVMARDLLTGRPGLGGFADVTTQTLADAIRGTGGGDLDGDSAFGRFTGQWYGLWGTMKVDHSWDRIDHAPRPFGPERCPRPLAMQFAWVGEAFCWHLVGACPSGPQHRVILGTVYHVRGRTIQDPVPHVAVAAPEGRLIWITPSHVFFEEVSLDERYVITGFAYAIRDGRLSIKDGGGFQAIYTRSPSARPPFFTFRIGSDN